MTRAATPLLGDATALRLEARSIRKSYAGFVANDGIDLAVRPGEVHAILGENGAGKSTLMNVLFGLSKPDSGEILIDGNLLELDSPRDAIAAGIGMVHQHFMLVPVFSVAENVMLGFEETGPFGWLRRRRAERHVASLAARYGLDVSSSAVVDTLPVGVQQRVEILKALAREARVLILDEPTAVLTPGESRSLFRSLRSFAAAGGSVIFITHKLREVKEVADTITVIRLGRVVANVDSSSEEAELARLMVGRPVQIGRRSRGRPGTKTVLRVRDLVVTSDDDRRVVDAVSFDVVEGEILCIGGVEGNGQRELAQALLGLVPVTAGSITLDGKPLEGRHTGWILRRGVGYVPEDRQHDGIIRDFTVAENLVLDRFRDDAFSGRFALKLESIETEAERLTGLFDVRPRTTGAPVGSLSGGNQQKVVIAREMARPLRLLVVAQPTRGLDIGAAEFVHEQLRMEQARGTAIVVFSCDLDEIYRLASRIAVMYEGRFVGVVDPETSRDAIGLLMSGVEAAADTPEFTLPAA